MDDGGDRGERELVDGNVGRRGARSDHLGRLSGTKRVVFSGVSLRGLGDLAGEDARGGEARGGAGEHGQRCSSDYYSNASLDGKNKNIYPFLRYEMQTRCGQHWSRGAKTNARKRKFFRGLWSRSRSVRMEFETLGQSLLRKKLIWRPFLSKSGSPCRS